MMRVSGDKLLCELELVEGHSEGSLEARLGDDAVRLTA